MYVVVWLELTELLYVPRVPTKMFEIRKSLSQLCSRCVFFLLFFFEFEHTVFHYYLLYVFLFVSNSLKDFFKDAKAVCFCV